MSGRAHRDRGKERFWRQMLRQWRRSGLSIRDFCLQHHLSEPSFYDWRRTIADRDRQAAASTPAPLGSQPLPSSAPLFVPVRVAPSAAPPPLELVCRDGRVLRVPAGFDGATLRQLLALLDEAPPC